VIGALIRVLIGALIRVLIRVLIFWPPRSVEAAC
jgi:hypothetical protein